MAVVERREARRHAGLGLVGLIGKGSVGWQAAYGQVVLDALGRVRERLQSAPQLEIMGPAGMEEMTEQLRGMFGQLGQSKRQRRKLALPLRRRVVRDRLRWRRYTCTVETVGDMHHSEFCAEPCMDSLE